eukprot:Skav233056  [mRNA]  locus=scaffold2357:21670:23499:+ [translate_table: standard]
MANSNSRLKYRIARCTSEDPDFKASELLSHSQQTKGWQTAAYCDFPQEVCLQFESPVHLRQVQFLSHQSKIATKIELFTGMAPAWPSQLEDVQFKRLGYLSLDNNERSQFQARELKSVYVDVVTHFLRIVFHKCHINRYNTLNQVGLIALSCLGEVLDEDLPPPLLDPVSAPVPTAPAPQVKESQVPERQPPRQIEIPEPAPSPVQPSITKAVSDLADVDETKYDVKTWERLKSLVLEKQKCVEVEDYGGAKRCKQAIVMLKKSGLRIRELEEQKKAAVENEEYDLAKSLKWEIDRLRNQCEGVEEKEMKIEPPAAAQQEKHKKIEPPAVAALQERKIKTTEPPAVAAQREKEKKIEPPGVAALQEKEVKIQSPAKAVQEKKIKTEPPAKEAQQEKEMKIESPAKAAQQDVRKSASPKKRNVPAQRPKAPSLPEGKAIAGTSVPRAEKSPDFRQNEVLDTEFQRVNEAPSAPPRLSTGAGAMCKSAGREFSDEEFEERFNDFRCEFCGREDPTFTLPALDVHYWRECPMLAACQYCEQVIEISRLHWHWMEECEKGDVAIAHARRLHPDRCPLCQGRVCKSGVPEEHDWQKHLLVLGCPSNPRGLQSFR